MGELFIRQATSDHIDGLTELDKISFAQPWSRESFRKEIEENKIALYIVGEVESKVVGYVGIWKVGDEGHITNVAVHPDYRGKGIGKALLAVLMEFTKRENITFYTLEVRISNATAIHLYETFGFKEAGLRKKYYPDNLEDALIMNKTSV